MLKDPELPGETQYERDQRFNSLVSWLHARRYANILRVCAGFARTHGNGPIRIVDIGCAHAKLFSILDAHFPVEYTGIETNSLFVEAARSRYGHRSNFRIVQGSASEIPALGSDADIVVALETLEHIPERNVVRIVEAIAASEPGLFICSVPVEIGPALWLKNFGSWLAGYKRHREYSWRETFWAGLYRLDRLPPHGIEHKGFDWRWLAQTIRHNMRIVETRRLPLPFIPAPFAFSIFMVAEPRG